MSRICTAAFVLLALFLASCGGDGEPVEAGAQVPYGGSDTVEVVAQDIGFDHDRFAATAGTVHVRYRNDGRIAHSLVVEGLDGFKLEVADNDDLAHGSVDLEPGTYTIYCDIPGHREVGMVAELHVT